MKFVLSLFLLEWLLWRLLRRPANTRQRNRQRRPPQRPRSRRSPTRRKRKRASTLKEYQQITAKVQTAQQKLVAAPVGEDALILAAALSLPRNYGRASGIRKTLEDWLRNVQARTKCKDCGINLETRTSCRRKRELTGWLAMRIIRATGFLT